MILEPRSCYPVAMIKVELKNFRRLENDLLGFARKAYPYATQNTINSGAFHAQALVREGLKSGFVNRNKFTVQSIQVEKSRTLVVSQQAAFVGSIAPYLETQEFGGVKRAKGGKSVPIATGFSAGQEGARPRTRLPVPSNKMRAIKLPPRARKGMSRVRRNVIAVKSAEKFVFLDLGRRKGIFKKVGEKIKMVHDLTRSSVRIPKKPWLLPAVQKTYTMMYEMFTSALEFQLKRRGLFNE